MLRVSNSLEARGILSLLESAGTLRDMSRGAARAAERASGSVQRSLEALERFGLMP